MPARRFSWRGGRSPFLFWGLVSLILSPTAARAILESEYYAGEVQVILQPGVSVQEIHDDYGTFALDSLPPAHLLRIPLGQDETAFADLLAQDPRIAGAECSWRAETPEGTRQMVVAAVGGTIEEYLDQELVERIHLPEIQAHLSGAGVRVAVLDGGVRVDHEALAGSILPGGWDFVDGDADPADGQNGTDEDGDGLIDEGAGHGTMVAGIVHLTAPGAGILPVRVLDDEGNGRIFTVAKGIRHALEQGAQIINLSLGMIRHSILIQEELLRVHDAGVALVAAAGNLGTDNPAYYPALDPRVLSVAALDSLDVKADFSNWHRSVDLSAPGVGVFSTYMDGAYAVGAGTSFASPFATGACALILESGAAANVDGLYDLARLGVVDIYSIPENFPFTDELGSGRVDGLMTWSVLQASSPVPDAHEVTASRVMLEVRPLPARAGQPVSILCYPVSRWDGVDPLLLIFDAQGRSLRTLTGRPLGSDAWTYTWSGDGRDGQTLPAGIYFLRPASGGRPARIVLR